jgi:hypothetical protein
MAEGGDSAGTAEEEDAAAESVGDVDEACVSADNESGRLHECHISVARGVDDAGGGNASLDKAATILGPSTK